MGLQRQIIIHADDLGLSPAITQGILKAMAEGVVSSTSLLCNFPESRPALKAALKAGHDVGWHLNLVQGSPLTAAERIPSLVGKDGNFLPLPRLTLRSLRGALVPSEIKLEMEAQYQLFTEAGVRPSHVDGHLHTHLLPGIREVLKEILRKKSISFIRVPRESGGLQQPRWLTRTLLKFFRGTHPDYWRDSGAQTLPFFGLALSGRPGEAKFWEHALRVNPHPLAECMVHPGYFQTEEAALLGEMGAGRQQELTWLTSPTLRKLLEELQYQVVSFKDLEKISKKN